MIKCAFLRGRTGVRQLSLANRGFSTSSSCKLSAEDRQSTASESPASYRSLKKAELRELLASRGILFDKDHLKDQLLERLFENDRQGAATDVKGEDTTLSMTPASYQKLKKVELGEELTRRGILYDTKLLKDELISRLIADDGQKHATSKGEISGIVTEGKDNPGTTERATYKTRQLPLSPFMDPVVIAARTKHDMPKARPTSRDSLTEFQRILERNPYAQALATPIRICRATEIRLPAYFLQDFSSMAHPTTQKPWFVPRSLTSVHAKPLLEVEGSSDPRKLDAPPVGGSSYVSARRLLLRAFIDRRSGYHEFFKRLNLQPLDHAPNPLWRTDMDSFVLNLMRRRIVEMLVYLTGKKVYLVAGRDWDDIRRKPQLGSILWVDGFHGEEGPGEFATLEMSVQGRLKKVPVHNLGVLLGKVYLDKLRTEAGELFAGGVLALKHRNLTVDVQLKLWKLQGYLAMYDTAVEPSKSESQKAPRPDPLFADMNLLAERKIVLSRRHTGAEDAGQQANPLTVRPSDAKRNPEAKIAREMPAISRNVHVSAAEMRIDTALAAEQRDRQPKLVKSRPSSPEQKADAEIAREVPTISRNVYIPAAEIRVDTALAAEQIYGQPNNVKSHALSPYQKTERPQKTYGINAPESFGNIRAASPPTPRAPSSNGMASASPGSRTGSQAGKKLEWRAFRAFMAQRGAQVEHDCALSHKEDFAAAKAAKVLAWKDYNAKKLAEAGLDVRGARAAKAAAAAQAPQSEQRRDPHRWQKERLGKASRAGRDSVECPFTKVEPSWTAETKSANKEPLQTWRPLGSTNGDT